MILLVNDDGVDAPGLRALYRALRTVTGQAVLAVAPHQERSGQGHAITLDRGLTVTPRHEPGFFGFAIDGTPTDCVKLALTTLCAEPPELVVSGINDGPNVGRSIFYSGTLGAAMEAAVEGFSALAVSRERSSSGSTTSSSSFIDAAAFAAEWAQKLRGRVDLRGQVVNLNLPARPRAEWAAARVLRHGRAGFNERYRPVRDAKDRVGWRLHGEWHAPDSADTCDAAALTAGHPVLTLLAPNLNAPERALKRLLGSGSGGASRAKTSARSSTPLNNEAEPA